MVIPIETTNQGGATAADYSGVPGSVTFDSGDTTMTFTVAAEADNVNDDGESVQAELRSGPAGVRHRRDAGHDASVTITDDDVPAVTVQFGARASYTVAESDDTGTATVTENAVEVTVTLSADPERTVIIPIVKTDQGGATSH